MPGNARKDIVREGEIGIYHCWSRCVQQAFLYGSDPRTGQNFEHRRVWIKTLLEYLASVFAVDIGNYTVLSNHQHLIARTRPDIAATWTDEEVAWRWKRAWPHWDGERWLREPTDEEIEKLLGEPWRLPEIRANLASLSWLMARWKEPIAKAANRESGTKGHYYDGRFGSREICDDAANLCCNAYLDLNQLKAGLAPSLDQSSCSAIQDRLRAWRRQKARESVDQFLERSPEGYELHVSDVEQLLEDCFLACLGDQGPPLLLGAADAPRMQGPEQSPLIVQFVPANSPRQPSLTAVVSNVPRIDAISTERVNVEPVNTEQVSTESSGTESPGTKPANNEAGDSELVAAEPVQEHSPPATATAPSTTSYHHPTGSRAGPGAQASRRAGSRRQPKPAPTRKIHEQLNKRCRPRASDNPFLGVPREQYFGIVQWSADQLGAEAPEGPPENWGAELRRRGVEPSRWLEAVKHFGELFHRAVGRPDKLAEVAQRKGQKRIHGSRACRDAFT